MATKEKWVTVNGKHMLVNNSNAQGKKSTKPNSFDKLNNVKSKKSSDKKGKK